MDPLATTMSSAVPAAAVRRLALRWLTLALARLALLLTTHYLLLTTHYSLLTTHYSLLNTQYSILNTQYSILTYLPTFLLTFLPSYLRTYHLPLSTYWVTFAVARADLAAALHPHLEVMVGVSFHMNEAAVSIVNVVSIVSI